MMSKRENEPTAELNWNVLFYSYSPPFSIPLCQMPEILYISHIFFDQLNEKKWELKDSSEKYKK